MSKKSQTNKLSGNCYKDFPEYYDVLYQRYFKSIPTFISLIENNLNKEGQALEIAAGTGEVAIPLSDKGYSVTCLDLNAGMLEVLKRKAKEKGLKVNTVVTDMAEINFMEEFDLIYMRQSINYFMGRVELVRGLGRIYSGLKPGGKFVFNAPNYKGLSGYSDVQNIYEVGDIKAFVLETNILNKNVLKHRQDSVVWSSEQEPMYIHDENTFYMFTKEEFEQALEAAGFREVKFLGNELRGYTDKSKTIYGVATK